MSLNPPLRRVEKSGDLSSGGKDSLKYAPHVRHAPRTLARSFVRSGSQSERASTGRSMLEATRQIRETRRERERDRGERRRGGIFAIPIPSSTSSLAHNLHLRATYLPSFPRTFPRDVDVSRVTSPAAECSTTTDKRKHDVC